MELEEAVVASCNDGFCCCISLMVVVDVDEQSELVLADFECTCPIEQMNPAFRER